MLQPKLTIEKEARLVIRDLTGFYSTENPGGWGGVNLARSQVESALVELSLNRERIDTLDVTDVISNSLDAEVLLAETDAVGDGIYKVWYKINGEILQFPSLCFVHEQLSTDLSKMWAYLARIYDSYVYREWAKECIWIDSHERLLDTFKRRGNEMEYLKLLKIATERIEYNKPKMI